LLAGTKNRVWSIMLVGVSGAFLFLLLLLDSVENLHSNYIAAAYASSGAPVRVAMNAMPGALFLIFRKRFRLSVVQDDFWGWMSWASLLFVVILVISPSSTAVDRLALYFIPLQLFVWSRMPEVLGSAKASNRFWVMVVVVYSASVMLVWMFFAVNATAWLPYKFFPLRLL